MAGPLAKLKVLDFTTLLPGPFASMILADLGASVLRVEAPGRPDMVREMKQRAGSVSAAHATVNRSKRCISLDLKNPEALRLVEQLLEGHDILLEQFRPGVMERLGLGYEQLQDRYPGLIYCSLTGYGQTGPYRNRAGHDINYLALSGLSETSRRQNSGPVPFGFQLADIAGGSYHMVMAVLAAVIHRQQTGEGQYIDLSMTDAVFSMHALSGAEWLSGGEEPEAESGMLNGGTLYDYYETRDGRWISVGSLEPVFLKRLCLEMDLQEFEGIPLDDVKSQKRLKSKLRKAFKTRGFQEWIEIFQKIDACVEPVLKPSEAARHPQLREREMIGNVKNEIGDSIRQIGSPFRFSKTPVVPGFAGRKLGADTLSVLRELGWDDERISTFLESGACGDIPKADSNN